jgi:signal transduction histidine kinase
MTMSKQRVPGAIQSAALVVLSLGVIGWVGTNLMPNAGNTGSAAGRPATSRRPTTAPTARAWLGLLGLEADALAASGVNGEAATVILADLQAYLDENGDALFASIDAHNAAKKQVDMDERMLRAAKPEEGAAAHASTLAAAAADRNSRQAAALAAATAHLTDDQRTRLNTIRGNSGREVPAAYCLVSRTDAEWVALRDTLAGERQASDRGEQLPEAARTFLANIRADTTTATGLSNAASLIAGVRAAIQ